MTEIKFFVQNAKAWELFRRNMARNVRNVSVGHIKGVPLMTTFYFLFNFKPAL
jgi:hypothetical protein